MSYGKLAKPWLLESANTQVLSPTVDLASTHTLLSLWLKSMDVDHLDAETGQHALKKR